MGGQVFRITELNPTVEMEISRLLEAVRLENRFSSRCDLFGVFDSEGSLAGITGSREFEEECLLHFLAVRENERGSGLGTALVSRVLSYVSGRCERIWVLARPGTETYFERFGFESATSALLPERIRESRDLAEIEIASAKIMTLVLPEGWPPD
jgi:N-acetylglutamate synthase-like GNAT family acetyltransferase